jgi:hypothetical protein
MRARHALGFIALGLAGVLLVAIFRPATEMPATLPFQSSGECRTCHAEVYREWESSWHAQAWTDPDVRALSNDFANSDCVDCHAPRAVFETGVGERVLPRAARRSEGVDCITCHALVGPDAGRVAGKRDNTDAACRPKAVPELASVPFCAVCHDQHQTITEWMVSRYAAEGVDCIACHMPFRAGDPSRGRDHTMHGGHSLELLRSAVTLRARRQGNEVVIEVENVGAGHAFPTDERSRAADVFWRPLGEPRGPWRHLYRIRSPYRDEVGLESNLLMPHEVRTIAFTDPEAATALEVAIFYKLMPYWADPARPDPEREALLVHALELGP